MGTPRYRRDGVRGERERTRGARSGRRGRARNGRLSAIALALVALLAATGCRAKKTVAAPPAPPEPDFTAIDSPSLRYLPRDLEAKPWRLEENPIVIPGERIRRYLGAAAESFIHHDVTDVTAGKYAEDGGPGFATIEIFRFPDGVKAFGAYSILKDAARRFVPISGEAYVSKFAVHVWRGPFYIRVTGGAKNAFDSLTRLAAFVAERMPEAAKPAIFSLFPDRRVPHSERYSIDEGLGQKLLGNSFQATFNIDGDVMTGLIIPSPDRTTATTILGAYRGLYVRNGRLLDSIPNLGEDNFTAEDHYLGRVVAFRNGRFVVAFNGYKDRKKLIDLAIATNARIAKSADGTRAVDGRR